MPTTRSKPLADLLGELDDLSREIATATRIREDLLASRAAAICALSSIGVPRSAVAKLTGLTRGRVQQILAEAAADGDAQDGWKDEEVRRQVEAAVAARPVPSVGVGLRRESVLGPHLGEGWGGKILLTGEINRDRDEVIGALVTLLNRARAGAFDSLLTLTDEESAVVAARAASSGARP